MFTCKQSSQMMFLSFSLLLLVSLSFHDVLHHHLNDDSRNFESDRQVRSSVVVVDALTNANDVTAMLKVRQAFNVFPGNNWTQGDDPCAGESSMIFFVLFHCIFPDEN
jgi:hypothetical protein